MAFDAEFDIGLDWRWREVCRMKSMRSLKVLVGESELCMEVGFVLGF